MDIKNSRKSSRLDVTMSSVTCFYFFPQLDYMQNAIKLEFSTKTSFKAQLNVMNRDECMVAA